MAFFDLPGKFISLRTVAKAAVLVALLGSLSACGGGSSAPTLTTTPTTAPTTPSNPNPAPDPAPPAPAAPVEITGVAIPSSVSVVTANNAS